MGAVLFRALLLVGACVTLSASEVAAPTLAKIIKVLVLSSGDDKVACQDGELSAEMGKVGIQVDQDARIAWAVNERDVIRYAKGNKLVVCGHTGLIAQGAAIAVVAEGGRPAIYINTANATTSKVTIPDSFLKLGKVVK